MRMRYLRLTIFLTALGMLHAVSAQTVTYSADEVGRAWTGNALGAEMKYSNKPIQIVGTFKSVSNSNGNYIVRIDADSLFTGIAVYLASDANLEPIANLTTGQRITMYCDDMKDSLGIRCYNGRLVQ